MGPASWHRDEVGFLTVIGPLLVSLDSGVVQAVDLETGKQRWRSAIPDARQLMDIGEGLVATEDDKGGYRVLDGATGESRSRYLRGNAGGYAEMWLAAESYPTPPSFNTVTERRFLRVRENLHAQYVRGPGDLICCVGSETGLKRSWLYGINRETGAVAWKTRMTAAGALMGPWVTATACTPSLPKRGPGPSSTSTAEPASVAGQ